MKRREFLGLTIGACAGAKWAVAPASAIPPPNVPFEISLAEWSLKSTLFSGQISNLDFARVAKRDFDIDTIEFVDQFFPDKARDDAYLRELRARASDEGVRMGLIMIDMNGPLGSAQESQRASAVEKTKAWIDAAKFLDCHTIRVNARGDSDPGELQRWMAESCSELADYARPLGINVCIENHGGPSSDPDWLVGLMKAVDKPNFGTLPDFGNFPDSIDRYDAIEQFMPHAKAVSAKATRFSGAGEILETDYSRMLRIVRDGGYQGHIGVESVGATPDEEAHRIRATRDILRNIRDEQARSVPMFRRNSLNGWFPIAGGDWAIEEGVLTASNGRDWTTDPAKTGSWLRSRREYSDFRLELQFTINEGGNSGIFFRSAIERNPAFTGYEMQIVDSFGQSPTRGNAGSIFDLAPAKTMAIRPAGKWNTLTIVCKGERVTIDLNWERIIDAEFSRSRSGYIGLQNHDAKSQARFRNLRIERLA